MEGGSSPIRAAARDLTGISHYFQADFITRYEEEAHDDPVTTARARVLLEAPAPSSAAAPMAVVSAPGGTRVPILEQKVPIRALICRRGSVTLPA